MMSGPTLHDLKFIRDAFPDIQPPDSWEIPTSKSDDVILSVVRAYLSSFPPSDENELTKRLLCLTGRKEEIGEEGKEVIGMIKDSLERWNPFLANDTRFYVKVVSELLDFKGRVEREGPIQDPAQCFEYLETSSKLLSCKIVFISLEDKTARVFPEEAPSSPWTVHPDNISIFYESNSTRSNGNRQYQFSFGIPKDTGIEKMRQALIEILKGRVFGVKDEMLQKISELPDIFENFLLSLLRNGFEQVVIDIYKIPPLLSSLEYAGFQTDPRTKDRAGKSAFYHAAKAEEYELLSVLNYLATKLCTFSSVQHSSVHHYFSIIIKNLEELNDDLLLLVDDVTETEISKESKDFLRNLIRINEFKALRYILRIAEMTDNVENIKLASSRLPKNLTIWLVKNNFGHAVPIIYRSPYVLLKLSDAGFETDPKTKDSEGKSAFIHALITGNSRLVFYLYEHAASACLQTDASVRSKDPVIVENLKSLKDYLKLLEKDLENEDMSKRKRSRYLLLDLCRFNEFQIKMCSSINEISEIKPEQSTQHSQILDQTDESETLLFEASRRKKNLLAILKTYETHFHYIKGELQPSEKAITCHFIEFCKSKKFFDKLDFTSAAMFFDHLFLLQERLELEKDAYLNIEKHFFLFILFRKFLSQFLKQKSHYFLCQGMILQERLKLQNYMCSFKDILEKTEPSKDNIVNKLSKEDIPTLKNLPQIYGQFLILRLQHYLKIATKVIVNDLESILVIERCLQVIGECCVESKFNSVQSILILSLPKDLSKLLVDIRQYLSHIEPHEYFYREKLEKDKELFLEVQKDLIRFSKCLLPIYSYQKFEYDHFLLSYTSEAVKNGQGSSILKEWENELKDNLTTSYMEEGDSFEAINSPETSWESQFEDVKRSLREVMGKQNSHAKVLQKKNVSFYKYIIENMISTIEEVLKDVKSVVPDKIAELECNFWCLEKFLTFVATDRKLAEYRMYLKNSLEERESIFEKLKEKPYESQKMKKPTNSITTEPSVAERDRVRKQHLSESEGNRNQADDNVLLETTDSKECEEASDLGENAEDPEAITQTKENYSSSAEVSALCDDKSLANFSGENAGDPETCTQTKENYSSSTEVSTFCDDKSPANVTSYPVKDETENLREIKGVERKYSIQDVEVLLKTYKDIAQAIFKGFSADSNTDFQFESIKNYCLRLERKEILTKCEKESIVSSVPEKFRDVPKLKEEILNLLKENFEFTEELHDKLRTLKLKNQDIKIIKREIERGVTDLDDTLKIVHSVPDYFSDLKNVLNSEKLCKKTYDLLCEMLELPEEAKKVLFQLVPGQKVGPEEKLKFLRNRIEVLKKVLIYEEDDIKQLWEREAFPKKMKYVKEKIVDLYLSDFEFQASVETLLFHCMAISRNQTLKQLWRKVTNMFSGTNLRDVLAHGHPLLESLGVLLDPRDLPSELVGKMLQLITDEQVIHCMQQILEQSRTDFDGFQNIMKDEKNEEFGELRKQVLECDRWRSYARLIPNTNVKKKRDLQVAMGEQEGGHYCPSPEGQEAFQKDKTSSPEGQEAEAQEEQKGDQHGRQRRNRETGIEEPAVPLPDAYSWMDDTTENELFSELWLQKAV